MIVSLPQAEWPRADREGWAEASAPGYLLRRGGRASHLKPVMQADYARRYGYFLQVLRERDRLDPEALAGAQVSPEAVEAFLVRARQSWGSVTLAFSIYKLLRVAEILDPGRDWSWLKEVAEDLRAMARPRSSAHKLVSTEALVEAGLTLVREADLAFHLSPRRRGCLARNGLMVALLALCPIRLGTFTDLNIGTTFRCVGDRWWIVLAPEMTKTGRADERPVPDLLNDALSRYLDDHRPVLLGRSVIEPKAGPLWVGLLGEGLTYSAVNLVITKNTRETLGVAVNPHAFRSAAASTAAFRAARTPGLASALLQHTDRSTTDTHYNRATSLQAGLVLGQIVRRLNR